MDLTYDVYFNDKDGASIPFVTSYGAKDNIFVGAFHDATDFNLAANANSNRDISFTDNNMERAIRLNDEKSKGQLKLNILNGIMQVQIGAFIIDIPFEFYNVPVS